jgi:hypothetical protein
MVAEAPSYAKQLIAYKTMPNYSKAPRGLFVQVEVGRVFTAIAISPSRGSRQLLTRDAFRAGRNLPDKELRSFLIKQNCLLHLKVFRTFSESSYRYEVRTISYALLNKCILACSL